MKDRDLGRHTSKMNQIMVFERTRWTEADRADVPAAIAFDAFGKLVHPEAVPLFFWLGLDLVHNGKISTALHLLADVDLRRVWLETLALFSEFSRAGNSNKDDLLLIKLLILVKLDEGAFIASPREDSERIIWVFLGQSDEEFCEGISDFPEIEFTQLLRLCE